MTIRIITKTNELIKQDNVGCIDVMGGTIYLHLTDGSEVTFELYLVAEYHIDLV